MAKGIPSTDLCADINKLVTPGRGNQTLAPREARSPIEQQKGSGKAAESSSSDSPASASGTLTSSDGMFIIEYEFHTHGL